VCICPWLTDDTRVDYFSTNGSTLRFLRPTIDTFEQGRPLLIPDPARVSYWRNKIEALGKGLYIGFCWRSMVMTGSRRKYFSPLDHWAPVIRQPGAIFVNLQYGDCQDEIAYFAENHGVTIHNFNEINLKDDLDDLAALGRALDLLISAPTASGAITAATGTEMWVPAIAGYSWTQFGTDHFPLHPKSRSFWPANYGDWTEVMEKIAAALEKRVAGHREESWTRP
jgi:hypothetical protein